MTFLRIKFYAWTALTWALLLTWGVASAAIVAALFALAIFFEAATQICKRLDIYGSDVRADFIGDFSDLVFWPVLKANNRRLRLAERLRRAEAQL